VDYLVSDVGVLGKAMFLLNLVEYHQPIGFQALNEAVGYPARPPTDGGRASRLLIVE
jgi:hypothetical protein